MIITQCFFLYSAIDTEFEVGVFSLILYYNIIVYSSFIIMLSFTVVVLVFAISHLYFVNSHVQHNRVSHK